MKRFSKSQIEYLERRLDTLKRQAYRKYTEAFPVLPDMTDEEKLGEILLKKATPCFAISQGCPHGKITRFFTYDKQDVIDAKNAKIAEMHNAFNEKVRVLAEGVTDAFVLGEVEELAAIEEFKKQIGLTD